MIRPRPIRNRNSEAGYTLLLAVFLVATMIILAAAAMPSILTEGRREKEADMVWRGEQYQRAILLYQRKFGNYPTKIEDLTRPTNGVRFLRKAYTDPMNKDDGSWRFIYVGPNGQLIGSLKQTSLLQNALPTAFGSANPFGAGLQPLAAPGPGTQNAAGAGPGGAGAPGTAMGAAAPNPLESQPQSLMGNVIGGNIIGVGSKVKQHSLRVYQGGDTYEKWEFIANPLGQGQTLPGQAPVNPNGATAAPNPANPNGTPNPPDNSQLPQNPQTPIINVPPPVSPAPQ